MAKGDGRNFWRKYPEKEELNQYWYSPVTVEVMAAEVIAQTTYNSRIAFLSTPSVYFAIRKEKKGRSCYLFDLDEKFDCEGDQFVRYDFYSPETIDPNLHQTFDYVVIDPPFITKEVWELYAKATNLLLAPRDGKILLSTIEENADMIKSLLDCERQKFRPSIPHLVYQYALYTNYPSSYLAKKNPEVLNSDDE